MKKILPALIITILCFFISSCSREEKQKEIWSPESGEWISLNEYRELERTRAQMRTQRWKEQSQHLKEKSQEQRRIMDRQEKELEEYYP